MGFKEINIQQQHCHDLTIRIRILCSYNYFYEIYAAKQQLRRISYFKQPVFVRYEIKQFNSIEFNSNSLPNENGGKKIEKLPEIWRYWIDYYYLATRNILKSCLP